MHSKRLPALLCTLLACVAARASHAETANPRGMKVVIVGMTRCCSAKAWPEAEKKVEAELSSLNFTVEVLNGDATGEEERRIELGVFATQAKATCALRIVKTAEGGGAKADLWVNNPATGKAIVKTVDTEGMGASKETSIFALRILEALRASLLDISVPAATIDAPKADKADSVAAQETAHLRQAAPDGKPPSFTAALGIGGGAMGFANDAGLMGNANISVRAIIYPPFSAEIDGLFSYPAKDLYEGEERTSFNVAMVRAWALWEPVKVGPLQLSTGPGAGVITMSGVRSGVLPRANRTTTAYVGATAQIAIAVWKSLGFRLGMDGGRSLPEVQVNFAHRRAAAFGKPLLDGFARVEITLF